MIEIYVATHKKINFNLPQYYRPVQVNCAIMQEHWSGYIHDDSLDNISEKNDSYCELTALYWGWKNSRASIKGLCHYRRFFSRIDIADYNYFECRKAKNMNILMEEDIKKNLLNYDMILLFPYRPYPLDARADLKRFCYEKDINVLYSVIHSEFPEYESDFLEIMKSKHLSYRNMFIAKSSIYDEYCTWLFDVLEKVEKQCNIKDYDTQHKRIYGYFGEVLLNVYVRHNRLKCKYYKGLNVWEYIGNSNEVKYYLIIFRDAIFNITNKIGEKWITDWLVKKFRKEKYDVYNAYKNYINATKKSDN